MVDPSLTIVFVLLLGAALIVLVFGVSVVMPPASRIVARSFWCPFLDRNVTVGFTEEPWDAAPFDVARCSAFTPAGAVACDKLCLRLPELPPERTARAPEPRPS